jgi:hypothetical protein
MDFTNMIYSHEPQVTPPEQALLQDRLAHSFTNRRTPTRTLPDRIQSELAQKALIQKMIQEELGKKKPEPPAKREMFTPEKQPDSPDAMQIFIIFVLIIVAVICFIQYKQTETILLLMRIPAQTSQFAAAPRGEN